MFLSETSWIRFGRYFGIFKVFMSDDSIWKFLWIGTRLKISKCQKSFFSHFFVTDAQKGPSFWMFYLLNLHFPIFYWDPRNWSSFWTLSWDVSTTENRQTCSVFRMFNLGKQRVPPLRFAQNLTLWGLDDKNVIFLNLPLTYAFLFLMKSEPKVCLTRLRRIQSILSINTGTQFLTAFVWTSVTHDTAPESWARELRLGDTAELSET